MLIDDLRFTTRLMRKKPGMGLLVIAALLFGIGVNTAIFSVVNAVLLRPLPIFEPNRVAWIRARVNKTGAPLGISYPEYLDWKNDAHAFEAITALRAFSFYSSGGDRGPEHLKGSSASADVFKVFGVKTVLGRDFTERDDRPEAQRVVVLSYSFWERRFGKSPDVLGKSLTLDDQSYTIIGVLQPTQLAVLRYPDVWVPNAFFVDQKMHSRDSRYYFPAARLKSDVTAAQAQTEMETIAARLAAQYPASNKDMGIRFTGLTDQLTTGGRKPLSLLLTASILIFVLACVNILIVFLSSTAERRKELSIRLALGSSRFHLMRQLFLQALLFVGAGSVLGLAAAKLGLVFFMRHFPDAVLRFQETTVDYRVISFMMGLALITILLATVLPAWYVSRFDVGGELKGEPASSGTRLRSLPQGALIVFEVMLASSLSLASGLLIKSFYQVAKIDLGFNPHRVLSFQINLPTRYKNVDRSVFYKQALEKLSDQPGMSVMSGIESLPLTTQGNVMNLEVDAQSPLVAEKPLVEYDSVLPGLFNTIKLPVFQGRDFTDGDRGDTLPVVIVDNVLAAKFWPRANPIGKRLRLYETADSKAPWREVVGVVQEVKHFGPEAKVRFMQAYVPEYQVPTTVLSFVVDSPLPEATVKASAERAIHELDPELPVEHFQSMDTLLDGYMASRKVSLLVISVFAGVAILLGTIGVYGVISNSVMRRRRDIAIRMALGATPRTALMLVARLGLFSTLTGIALGIVLVLSLTKFLASFLYGVTALDPGVYLISSGIIITLALLGIFLPAKSILSLNPQKILRE